MILVFVPNPALDKTAIAPGFRPGGSFRTPDTLSLAGGKGFNFARATKILGGRAQVVAPLGGYIGALVKQLADQDALDCDPFTIAAETRTCLTIVDPQAHNTTDLNEVGPRLDADTWRQIIARVAQHLPEAEYLAVCGSFPPGAPDDTLQTLVAQAAANNTPALLDTYGPALALALQARPMLVKINNSEAAGLVGHDVITPQEAIQAAQEIQQRGAGAVIITLGEQGAVGVDKDNHAFGWTAPKTQSVSAVGSGDALFAAVASELSKGASLQNALRLGVAAGAANTLQLGAGVFTMAQVEQLLNEVQPIDELG